MMGSSVGNRFRRGKSPFTRTRRVRLFGRPDPRAPRRLAKPIIAGEGQFPGPEKIFSRRIVAPNRIEDTPRHRLFAGEPYPTVS